MSTRSIVVIAPVGADTLKIAPTLGSARMEVLVGNGVVPVSTMRPPTSIGYAYACRVN